MKIRDVMSDQVFTISRRDSIGQFVELLNSSDIHGLPVVDDEKVVGVVSTTDLMQASTDEMNRPGFYTSDGVCPYVDNDFGDLLYRQVGDIMTKRVVSCGPDATLQQACETLSKECVHRLLVLEEGKLVGILSQSDIIRAIAGAAHRP